MKASIEKQEDGTYIAYNTGEEENTVIGVGATVKETKTDFQNTLKELAEVYEERGLPVPEYLSEPVEYRFDISSLFEYYSMINVSAFARYLGINDSLMRQYKKGDTPISDKQLEKIERGLHSLGKELASLRIL